MKNTTTQTLDKEMNNSVIVHAKAITYRQNALKSLITKYPQFFSKGFNMEFDVPVGWLKHVEHAFDAFAASGLEIQVEGIVFAHGALRLKEACNNLDEDEIQASYNRSVGFSYNFLTSLLANAKKSCVLCGLSTQAGERSRDELKELVCPKCLEIFGLHA